MNGRNRHIQYRNSVYRRRRIRTVLITVGVLLVILVLAFLIIGNILQRKSERRQGETADTTEEQTLPTAPTEKTPKQIGAYSVPLEAEGEESFADRVAALTDSKAALSIPLTDKAGALLYASPIAQQLGLQSADAHTVTVDAALQSVSGRYCSGVFYLSALSEENSLLRSVKLSQSAAILAEAAQAGLSEVVLIVPNMSAAQIDEVLHFAQEVRHLASKLSIGLAVSPSIRTAENSAQLLDRLYRELDLLAIEAVSGEGDAVAQTEALITDPGMRYNLLRYHMRLLFPTADAETQSALIAAAKKEGFANWQFLS